MSRNERHVLPNDMVIVLIQWKIKPGQEAAFQEHWEQDLRPEDCTGLVGEFLCKPGSEEYITWSLPDPNDPPCTVFVNVGIWASVDAFRKQIEPKFNDNKPPKPFEAARRVRTVLYPLSRRMGTAPLPEGSSRGVR